MIELYTAKTPNGRKVSVMLEELGMDYSVHAIDLGKREQFSPEFLALNPNNKIPVIRDTDTGQVVFESGAILIYLAEKAGRLLAPVGEAARAEQLEWLFFQMASIGPMMGQLFHFRNYQGEPQTYPLSRFSGEVERIYNVLETRLAAAPYLGGADYSVADIASYPWVKLGGFLGVDVEGLPGVTAWLERVGGRPAVQRGIDVPA
ncbi:glutathione S-transferase N-terminal domain-containing protein [Zavarzinia compransoris]|uniref:glutathione S-transferase family protein n=1 Tax=Zavarzinia marina TaxID=2911065 RepID=UPI001F3D1C7B|nr:glutathione S-transferase N-terminal domain-containing protein [Zavarzinia marina]MCF4164752.1 glutathione S-transferase N-terminal domain-containing protein [Zavarzinia marina]